MKTKTLVLYPDSILFKATARVQVFGVELHTLLDQMTECVKELNARGLAANQFGHDCSAAVIRDTETGDITELINPMITFAEGPTSLKKEGCLSIPGLEFDIPRHEQVEVAYLDRHGVSHKAAFDGEIAHTIQHEIDHLEGRLYTYYLGHVARAKVNDRMAKIGRLARKINAITDKEQRLVEAEERATRKFVEEMEEANV